MEEEEHIAPFWLPATDQHRRGRNLRRQASSIFLNSSVILIILLVIAFVFVFIIVPSIVSFTSQIFKPNLIKKSWDSLNLVLVLFAVVCGFLGRNTPNTTNNEISTTPTYQTLSSSSNVQQDVQRSYPSTPSLRWYDHDQYQDRSTSSYSSLNRLRSFRSYPDLRQESLWLNNDDRWRFYDDTHVNSFKFLHHDEVRDNHHPQLQQRNQEPKKQEEDQETKIQEEDQETKDIDVDTSVIHEKEVVHTPPLAPSPPKLPPKSTTGHGRRKVKRTYNELGLHEKRKQDSTPPPPPSSPPPQLKNDKKRGKDLLITLRRKKKKQRQKSVENLENLFNPEPLQSLIPPPPPPPPPPPHFFQNLFSSKKGKIKKDHSQSVSPSSRTHESRTRATVQEATIETYKPPKSVKTGSFSSVEENVESGNASPLIPIPPPPPPPPPPPFKVKPWRFVRDGDYVRVESFNSSRSGSPDIDGEDPSDKESSPMANSTMPLMFCPSPDVNTKAENFIARFRAGLKMEKVNSVKGRSNLGPGPDATS